MEDSAPAGGLLLIALAVAAVAYFLPALVAYSRGSANRASVMVVNLFLGWTFVGWVVALAMAVGGKEPRAHPPAYQPPYRPPVQQPYRPPDGLRLPPPPPPPW